MKKKIRFSITKIRELVYGKRLIYFILSILIIFLLSFFIEKIDFTNPSLGFSEYSKNEFYRPSKTLWDWLELLIVPITLVFGGYLLNRYEKKHERRIVDKRISSDRVIAEEKNQEIALGEYFDRMSELLLDKALKSQESKSIVIDVARTRTLTILRRLNDMRKGFVIRFLYESELIKKTTSTNPIIRLAKAELNEANLYAANFPEINLDGANLGRANLQFAILCDSSLNGADLRSTNLQLTNFKNSQLELADFRDANMYLTVLYYTNLKGAFFQGANLKDTMFVGAVIDKVNFVGCKSLTQKQIDEAFYVDEPPILPFGFKPPPQKKL